jgi:hypothetical protein
MGQKYQKISSKESKLSLAWIKTKKSGSPPCLWDHPRTMLLDWLSWLFTEIIMEAENHRQIVLYYRKPVWAKIHILSLNHLVAKCYTRLDPAAGAEVLQKRVLQHDLNISSNWEAHSFQHNPSQNHAKEITSDSRFSTSHVQKVEIQNIHTESLFAMSWRAGEGLYTIISSRWSVSAKEETRQKCDRNFIRLAEACPVHKREKFALLTPSLPP